MVIINYHNILPQPPNAFFAHVRREWDTQADFEQQILTLKSHFRMVSLFDMVGALDRGEKWPDACTITFDDGNLGAFLYGLPVLKKHNVPASFFIITKQVDGGKSKPPYYFDWLEAALYLTSRRTLDLSFARLSEWQIDTLEGKVRFFKEFRRQIKVTAEQDKAQIDAAIAEQLAVSNARINEYLQHEAYRMMTWAQITEMAKQGFTIGAHTRTHPSLSQIDQQQLEFEIAGSLQDLRDQLGPDDVPFAYPFGNLQHVSPEAIECVRQAGYRCALTMFKGKNKPGVDLFQLRRVDFKRVAKSFNLV